MKLAGDEFEVNLTAVYTVPVLVTFFVFCSCCLMQITLNICIHTPLFSLSLFQKKREKRLMEMCNKEHKEMIEKQGKKLALLLCVNKPLYDKAK